MPLRPLAVGDILSGAFTLIRRNPIATLGLAAIVETIYGVVSTLISLAEQTMTQNLRASLTPQATPSQVGHAFFDFFAGFLPYLALTVGLVFVFQGVLTGMLTGALGRGILGSKITIGEAWRIARVLQVIGISLLEVVLAIGLWLPVTLIVVALAVAKLTAGAAIAGVIGVIGTFAVTVWVFVRLSVAMPAVVLEAAGPVAAMRRSWQLVQGNWWRVFGISLLTAVVVGMIASILEIPFLIVRLLMSAGGGTTMPFGLAATATPGVLAVAIGAIGSIIASTCTRPVSAGVTVLLYADLRMRKEGLDLALQQAGQSQALTGNEFLNLWQPGFSAPNPGSGTLPAPAFRAGPGATPPGAMPPGATLPGTTPGSGPGAPPAW